MRTQYCLGLVLGAYLLLTGQAENLMAGDYYTSIPYLPTVKIGPDAEGATPVEEVYGKEYSHTNWRRVVDPPAGGPAGDPNLVNIEDHDAFGVPDPLQVVSWDGLVSGPEGNSGSVDAFDYGNSPGFNYPDGQVDALANRGDAIFRALIRDEATLLFSVTGDVGGTPGSPMPKGHVHFEDPAGPDAGSPSDVWAFIETGSAGPGPGAGVNHHPVYDLDALEVWGPEPPSHETGDTEVVEGYLGGLGGPNTADADRFSLDVDAASGVSVWAYDIPTAATSPWVLHSEIVDAVEALFLGPGERFDDETRRQIDVDGTMAQDIGDASPTAAVWDVGDELLFTIDPILDGTAFDASGSPIPAPLIDGGEIIHLVKTAAGSGPGTFSVSFLTHGGHLWDTAFDVSGTFGYLYEDVDALEAVGTLTGDTDIPTPEPSTLLLAGFALACVTSARKR